MILKLVIIYPPAAIPGNTLSLLYPVYPRSIANTPLIAVLY
jgi:hypothetical protein